jgi:tetratricopeptide (TPR) repeat protein
MTKNSKVTLLALAVLMVAALAVRPLPLQAAGGSSAPSVSPDDQAAEAYDRGLRYRDEAWELEEKSATAEGPEQAKLLAKAQKEYEKAIRAFRTAIEASPRMHQAHGSLGYALRKTGAWEESVAAYNRALELEPGYTEAIEYRAEAYLGLNRLDEVKDAYLELFRTDRERADELMTAMQGWIEQRTADPAGLGAATIEEFAAWVSARAEVAGQTASLEHASDRSW